MRLREGCRYTLKLIAYVVAKDIPDNSVVIGNPAKIIKTYDEFVLNKKKQYENSKSFDINNEETGQAEIERMKTEIDRTGFIIG